MSFKKSEYCSKSTKFKKGIRASPETEFKKGNVPWNKGKKRSEETKKKQKQKMQGREPWNKGLTKEIDSRIKCSEETRRKMSERNKGDKSWLWKGGITPLSKKIRNGVDLKLWRDVVFKRDNYTCIWCGARNKKGKKVILNADHIKPFSLFPELRFAIDNGRTLCKDCHRKTKTYAGKIHSVITQ